MYLVLNSLKQKGENKIITGDGADELFAGYNFFLKKTHKFSSKKLNASKLTKKKFKI